MNPIHIFAPVSGPEGYSLVARDLITHLVEEGIPVHLEEFPNWGPFLVKPTRRQQDALSYAKSESSNQQFRFCNKAITNLNICLPIQAKINPARRNVLYTMFEVDGIPQTWTKACEELDEVIVPSDFNHWSFAKTIPVGKISTLPIGIDLTRYNSEIDPLPLQTKQGLDPLQFPIRFLVVCEITNRKNFLGTLHTFFSVAQTIGVDKCCLILKVGNYSKQISVSEYIRRFKKTLIDDRSIKDLDYTIFLYPPILSEDIHPNFIKLGTHYLSTSFGEGWDMTAMQAAACGLHLFVPHHSAYQCWLTNEVCTLLPVARKNEAFMDPPLARFYEGHYWYAYNFQSSLQMIVDSFRYPEIQWKKQQRMKEHIQTFDWKNLVKDYVKVLHLQ